MPPSYFVFDQDGGIIDAYGSAPTLMQCTGLKDKTGKDIYEGDIIHRPGVNIPMLVRWNEKSAGFDLAMRDPADFDRVTLFYTQFAQEYEILGNIYEHPDLLGKGEEQKP